MRSILTYYYYINLWLIRPDPCTKPRLGLHKHTYPLYTLESFCIPLCYTFLFCLNCIDPLRIVCLQILSDPSHEGLTVWPQYHTKEQYSWECIKWVMCFYSGCVTDTISVFHIKSPCLPLCDFTATRISKAECIVFEAD